MQEPWGRHWTHVQCEAASKERQVHAEEEHGQNEANFKLALDC
jgi:hypothetical protein